ncbi:hypothetical protein TRAPUB_547 [Trametes pubescens]|uniref:Fe2OG dioxygenase domain-containing protein n=1 Tax=Trametes pubescens TaxID=154538 RepID=A0A1M2VLR7_TRAPU|nr:hypothetical protein TRAPUB_547 [Trametes pubescens]
MFGSLVVVFPTPHEGGALVLRHDGRDWTFDSGKTLSAPGLAPSIAFVAFFSDVDHEVTPVVSGHRVTATYNLYFSPHTHTPDAPESTSTRAAPTVPPLRMFQPSAANVPELASTLHELLADPTFLQSGGTLGFGLRHEYPLPKTWGFGDPNPLVALERWLKGADAALLRACQAHGLQPVLRMLSEDEGDFEGHDWTDTEDVVVRPTLLDLVPYIDIIPDSIDDYLQYPYGATRMFRVDLFEAPKHTLPPGRAPYTRRYISPDEDRVYPYAGGR